MKRFLIAALVFGIVASVAGYALFNSEFFVNKVLDIVMTNTIKNSERIMKGFTDIPESLEGKWILDGNPKADFVIINTQGGPVTNQMTDEILSLLLMDARMDIKNFLLVDTYQYQTLDPKKFKEDNISFEEAKAYDAETVKIVADTIEYFKAKGKKVYVVGVSFGAFVVEDVLASFGNSADKYFIIVGRITMPEKVWKSFAKGVYLGFEYDEDGNSHVVKFTADQAGMGGGASIEDYNMSKLAAGLGYKDFAEKLKAKNLSNVVYAFGDRDEQVGRLSQEEIDFLKKHGANIIALKGDHSQSIELFFQEYFRKYLD